MHNRAAMIYNVFIEKYKLPLQPINSGDKIKYVYVSPNNEFKTNILGYMGKFDKRFEEKFKVDYDTQFEVTFIDPMQSLFDAVNWGKIDIEVQNINNFFEF